MSKYISWFKNGLEVSLLLFASALLLVNQWHMVVMGSLMPALPAQASTSAAPANSASSGLLPHGVPARYGQELGVNFDEAARAIPILENFDRGAGAITLRGDLLQRYISIASKTACQYCCGAKTLVFPDGKPACGCAHSAAMRGVALYLLQKYPQMSDSDILAEVNRWKAVFFPGPTIENAGQQTSNGAGAALPSQVGGC